MRHYAVVYETRYGPCGVVVSEEGRGNFATMIEANRISLVECETYAEALEKCKQDEALCESAYPDDRR